MTRKEILEKTIDFDDAIHRIIRLEEENAELKEAVKHFNPCGEWNDDIHDCEFRHYSMEYGDKLTKARELLKTFLLIADNKVSQMEFQLCVADAKQFLNSEVEK